MDKFPQKKEATGNDTRVIYSRPDISAFKLIKYCKILCPEVESEAVSQKQPVAAVTCELCLTLSRHAKNYGQGERGM